MKVKHVLMIAAVMLAMLAMPVSAGTVVTHSVTEGYKVSIPPAMTVGVAGDISISGLIDTKTQVNVSVKSANNWNLVLSDHELPYYLKDDDAGERVSPKNVLLVQAGSIGTKKLNATLDGVNPKYRGNYVDTLTFTVTQEAIDGSELIHSYDKLMTFINDAPTDGSEVKALLISDIVVDENITIIISNGKNITLDLNSHTLSSTNTRTATHNFFIDVNGGTLTVQDGTISYEHTGDNMGWNGAATVIDVTAGGVLNMEGVTVKINDKTDMNFAVHLNNWGEVTLNADNCVFDAPYCGVRVFNSGYDMNNVKITNSKLTGKTRAFWVHNYIGDLNSAQHSDDAIKARLNIDIYNNNNEFSITGTAVSPIRYGFGTTVYFDKESGYEVTP